MGPTLCCRQSILAMVPPSLRPLLYLSLLSVRSQPTSSALLYSVRHVNFNELLHLRNKESIFSESTLFHARKETEDNDASKTDGNTHLNGFVRKKISDMHICKPISNNARPSRCVASARKYFRFTDNSSTIKS